MTRWETKEDERTKLGRFYSLQIWNVITREKVDDSWIKELFGPRDRQFEQRVESSCLVKNTIKSQRSRSQHFIRQGKCFGPLESNSNIRFSTDCQPPQKSLYRLFRTRLSPRGREPLWPWYPPGVGPIGFLLVPPTSPFLSLLLSLSLVTSLFVPPTQASRLVGQLLAITTSQGGACNFPGDAPNAISSMVALDHGRSEETRLLYQSSRRRPATMLSSRDQRVSSTGRDPPSNRSKRFGARKSNSEPPTRRATSLRGTRWHRAGSMTLQNVT